MKYNRLHKDALSCMIIANIIGNTILWIILNALIFLFYFDFEVKVKMISNVILIIIGAFTFVSIFISPFFRYQRYRYCISDEMIDIIEGYLWISRNIVPIERIKQIEINSGPIDKIFKLGKLTVTTSGGNVQVKLIKLVDAEKIAFDLKDHINDYVKEEKQHEKSKI